MKKMLSGVSINEELVNKIAMTSAVEHITKSSIIEAAIEEYYNNNPCKEYIARPKTVTLL